MRHDELILFTHEELSNFTQEELEMLPADLMRKILDTDMPLPPSVISRLNDLIAQTNNRAGAKYKIEKIISENTNAIDLCKILVSIIYHAPDIYNGFVFILRNLFG